MSGSENKVTNILFAGIGGQGIIMASDLLAECAFRSGLDVKKSEIHGMSQRGGSVSGDVRFGKKVFSPMIPRGEADYLVALSADQVEVSRVFLKEDAVILTPEMLKDWDPGRSLNVAMLGALNAYLKFDRALWQKLMEEQFRKPELIELNTEAFDKGASFVS